MFSRAVHARYIRITPTATNSLPISMRADLILFSNDGNLPSTVTPLSATPSYLSAALAGDIGLAATYYSDLSFSVPLLSRWEKIDFASQLNVAQARSIRWFGVYKPSSDTDIRIEHNTGMRMRLDDIVVIDQSAYSGSAQTSTFSLSPVRQQ